MSDVKADARAIFLQALECGTPDELRRFLDDACSGDAALRARTEELLRAHRDAGNFLGGVQPLDATQDEPVAERAGTVIGPYKLMEQIGEGGMGLVFVAEQQQPVRRKVAVKVIKPGMDTRQVVARFEAERQALALMDHPHIAKVLDAGATASGRPYFVMELVKGLPITEHCDANNLGARERLALFVQVCQAVQHAHQKGVIHRDIKPSNVLVAPHDGVPVVKVIDFGVAKAVGPSLTDKTVYTRFAQMIGTPLYMSPEQAEVNQLDVDTRSDVYSLGVLLYELLTGTTPFDRDRFRTAALDEVRRIIREEDPPKPSTRLTTLGASLAAVSARRGTDPGRLSKLVRGELDWIVMKALEKDRDRRYDSADALARDVRRFLADEVVEARPVGRAYRLRRFVRKNRGTLAVTAAFAALLLTATVVSTRQAMLIGAERDRVVAAQEALRTERDQVVAARWALRRSLTRQTAERMSADLLRLSAVGNALAATVEQGDQWDEARFVGWMSRALQAHPDILGLCIAFQPGKFSPAPGPATGREAGTPPPSGADKAVTPPDGYSLYVHYRDGEPRQAPVAEALSPTYHYQAQGWYANTLADTARGWEEPCYDAYGGDTQMVAYTALLRRRDGAPRIGVLCLDLSLAYFRRLDDWLTNPNFGEGSYGFVLSAGGKVISHPHLRQPGSGWDGKPFPDAHDLWPGTSFGESVRTILSHTGDDVGQLTAIDQATGRRSRFLFTRFRPADWLFVAVVPEDDP
jgi:serine/threonine protein kinase